MRLRSAWIASGLFVFGLFSISLPAQEEKRPPTPKEKARELLEGVAETASAAKPDVAAFALLYVAENYDAFDHAKALDYMRQAFANTAAIPPGPEGWKGRVQSAVASAMAKLRLEDAIEMVKQIEPGGKDEGDSRQGAIRAIVFRLLQKKDFDGAIDLLSGLGSTGQFPFGAAQMIFEKLPTDDPRREALFGYATSAYTLRPGNEFADLVAKHWKELPRVQAASAVRAIVENVLNTKREPGTSFTSTLSSSKGAVTFTDEQNLRLFGLMYMIQEVDPKRASDLLDSRAELRAAVARFPMGPAILGERR